MPKRSWTTLALLACGAFVAWGAQPGVRASLAGTTVRDFPARGDVCIVLTGDDEVLFVTRLLTLHVPYDKVTTLEYGQHSRQRVAEAILISPLMLHTSSRKHYVTVGYTDGNGKQQVLVLQVGKNDLRAVLAGLEAKTGRKVEYTDSPEFRTRG